MISSGRTDPARIVKPAAEHGQVAERLEPVAYRVNTTGAMPPLAGACTLCGRDWLTAYWLAPVRASSGAGVFEERLPVCRACTRALVIEPGSLVQGGEFEQWREQRRLAPITVAEATDEIKEQVRRAVRRGERPVSVDLGTDAVAAIAQQQRRPVVRIHILAGWISGLSKPEGFDEMAPLMVEQVADATSIRVRVQHA